MAQIGIAIQMQRLFRGKQQPFSNVSHYRNSIALNPSPAAAKTLADEVVASLKLIYDVGTTFVSARVWSSGGTPNENETITMYDLTGTGSKSQIGNWDRERAYLVSWDAGRSEVNNKKVYLRKWFHSCSTLGSSVTMDGMLANTDQIPQAIRDILQPLAQQLTEIGPADPDEPYNLCSEAGRVFQGPAVVYPWLEHRQLGDQWR